MWLVLFLENVSCNVSGAVMFLYFVYIIRKPENDAASKASQNSPLFFPLLILLFLSVIVLLAVRKNNQHLVSEPCCQSNGQ